VNSELQEVGLLKGLAAGDRKIIEGIYKDHFNMIQSLIVNNNGTADDARDIFQEAMVVLYEKVRTGSFELNCQLKTYLYSVSKRLWLKRLQQNNRLFTQDQFGYTNSDNAKNQKYKCLMRLKKLFFSEYKNGNTHG